MILDRIKTYKLIQENNFQTVYLVESLDCQKFILKESKSLEQSAILKKEAEVLEYLNGICNNFCCPKIVEYGTHKDNFYLLETYYNEVDLRKINFSREKAEKFLKSFYRNLNMLHSLDCSGLAKYRPSSWKSFLIKNLKYFDEKILTNASLDYQIFKDLIDAEYRFFENMQEPTEFSILHNDLNSGNILFDPEKGIVYFVDFEQWAIGDPLKDLTKLIWMLKDNAELKDVFYNDPYFSKQLCPDNLVLKAYFYYDILFHFSQYDEKINIGKWKVFFDEELELIKNYESEDKWLRR